MSSEPISSLTSGNPAQSGDVIPIERLVASVPTNFSVTAASIAALAGAGGGGSWPSGAGAVVTSFDNEPLLTIATSASLGGTIWVNGSTTTVFVIRIPVPVGITVATLTAYFQGQNSGGSTFHTSFGLYNRSGTKLIDSGVYSTTTSATAVAFTTSFAPVTLAIDEYWFAFTTDGGSSTAPAWLARPIPSVAYTANQPSNSLLALMNTQSVKLGIAANASAAGVLPATLGSVSAVPQPGLGSTTCFSIPLVLFE